MIIKNKTLIHLVIIVVIVVVSCLYFLEESYKKNVPIALYYGSANKEDNNNNEDEKHAPIKVAEPVSKNIFSTLPPPDINPQFEIGDVREYIEEANIRGEIIKFKHIYNVTKVDEINGILCYRLKGEVYSLEYNKSNNSIYGMVKQVEQRMEMLELLSSLDICVGAQDGRIIDGRSITPRVRVKGDFLSIPMDEATIEAKGIGAYFKWMLSLKDNLSWTTIIDVGVKGSNTTIEIMNSTYTVVGRERINDKECFRIVNIKNIDYPTQNRTEVLKNIMWVDTRKRIIIKQNTILLPENIIVDRFELSRENFINN